MVQNKLFWGLQIESGKAYAQTVSQSFAIRQAVLQTKKDTSTDSIVKLFAKYENAEFLLCLLSAGDVETRQVPLSVKFETGAQLTLRVEGSPNVTVHLTGYCIPSHTNILTPGSTAVAVPFEGSQRSILVSTKKEKNESKAGNKRVSIDAEASPTPKKVAKGNKSVSFVEEDDFNFIKNGLPEQDDEDDEDEDDSDYTTEDDTDEDGMAAFLSGQLQQKMLNEGKKTKAGNEEEDEEEDEDEDEDDEDDDDDDDDDDEDEDDDIEIVDEDDDDEDEDEEDEDEDIGVAMKSKPASTPKSPKNEAAKQGGKNLNESLNGNKGNKKGAGNESKTAGTPKGQKGEPKSPETPKGQKSPSELKTPESKGPPPKVPSSAGNTPLKFVAKGGVMVQELKVGSGPVAKGGKMVSVYYSGRLKQNNKLFDKNDSGQGFKFRLGKGEVIRGWDIGVEGMKVGGKRKLIIPANLAYGKRGAPPDIPPNSTLVFDVELKNVS